MANEANTLRALIIGAGSAGLLTAQVLKQAGIPCTVFEQDTSLFQRSRDWNFGIYWAQSRLDECLTPELRALVESVQTDPNYRPSADSVMPVHNGETGELLKNLPAPWSLRLRRKKWLQLISNGVDIKWGKRLKHIETGENVVTVTFEDGTQETGNLLVGAEGAHSPTRKFLFGPEGAKLLASPVVASVAITTLSQDASIALRKLHPRYTITFHPNGTFTWHSIHDCSSYDPKEWTWMLMQTWRSDTPTGLSGPAILADFHERGKTFGPPFKEVFTTVPEGTMVWHNRLSYWPTKSWDSKNGLVTLAGDAAHPMTFHRGQGLNNAITDAADLLSYLRQMKSHTASELAAAVHKYEEALWPRGHEAVMASHENTMAVHDWSTMLQSPLFNAGLAKEGDGVKVDGVTGKEQKLDDIKVDDTKVEDLKVEEVVKVVVREGDAVRDDGVTEAVKSEDPKVKELLANDEGVEV